MYDPLETDSELSETNKHTIKIQSDGCLNCAEGTCLKCELKATDYNHTDSLEPSPIHSDISYKNLNRLSAVSTSSSDRNSEKKDLKVMTSSHESSSTFSSHHDELYECFNFTRPNYINLHSSSSKSSPSSPLKSPLKSTISITFRSPTKSKDSDRDSVYEDIDLEKNLSIVEEATIPQSDASLPTQEACQPDDLIILETPTETHFDVDVYSQVKFLRKSIEEVNAMVLESPDKDKDVMEESVFLTDELNYLSESNNMTESEIDESQIEYQETNHYEENHYTPEKSKNHYTPQDTNHYSPEKSKNLYNPEANHYSPEKTKNHQIPDESDYMAEEYQNHYIPEESKNHYENVQFKGNDYENINVETLKICDKLEIEKNEPNGCFDEFDNGNIKKVEAKNLNVRELAIRFESPTEQKGPFKFEKFKAEVKYPSLERKDDRIRVSVKCEAKPISLKSYKLSKNSARSLDENAFIKEFGPDTDRRRSLEVKSVKVKPKILPDLNLNTVQNENKGSVTPTSENKISLIQRFNEKRPPEIKSIIGFEDEKKLSRERIEKYKEERRNFLREKYSSQSFRSNPEQLTRIKIKKETEVKELPKFERRNTVDLGQRMRFSLAKSANNLDAIQSPTSPGEDCSRSEIEEKYDR